MQRLIFSFIIMALTLSACGPSDAVHSDFSNRRSETANNALFSIFDSTMTSEEREAMEFLYAYMPLPDMVDYDGNFYLQNVRTVLKAREELPWGKLVPLQEFRHFVLPVRVNNENLDAFRWTYYEELRDRVKDLSMAEAILEVNHWCHEFVTYTPSDERTSAPMATMMSAKGRCGEESTFLVTALRTMGIPARQVYTPRWAHTDNNHAWVEAWADGTWHFLGACEPEPVLNLGWFNAPASRGMMMHTKVFGRYNGAEEVMSRNACYTEINVTKNYAPVAQATVQVTDTLGNKVKGAEVKFMIYNEAEFYPVAKKISNSEGTVTLEAGLGDLVVWAKYGDRFGVNKCHVAKGDTTRLCLNITETGGFELDLEIVPPVENNTLPEVTDEQRQENNRRLACEDSIRSAYESTFDTSTRWLKAALGNHKVIKTFIEETGDSDLLWTLSRKDLHDVTAEVLNDHHANVPQKAEYLSDQLFNRFVRSPRIANERLSPFRQYFLNEIGETVMADWRNEPQNLVKFLRDSITIDTVWNPQSLRMQPIGSWKNRRTDATSRDILFVALARTSGLAARIDYVTGKVQYMNPQCEWQDVTFNPSTADSLKPQTPKGILKATYNPQPWMENPEYYNHFTLSIIKDGMPKLLNYGGTYKSLLENGLEVDAGTYALVSGTRLASGSVLAHATIVKVAEGDTATIGLVMRQPSNEPKVIGSFNSNNLVGKTGRGQFAVCIVQPNHEPTNHIMRDISARKGDIEAWKRPLVILFRSEDEAKRFNKAEFPGLPENTIWDIDKDGTIEKDIRRQMSIKDNAPLPIVFIGDTFDHVLFFSQGYTIGMGDQLMNAIRQLSK